MERHTAFTRHKGAGEAKPRAGELDGDGIQLLHEEATWGSDNFVCFSARKQRRRLLTAVCRELDGVAITHCKPDVTTADLCTASFPPCHVQNRSQKCHILGNSVSSCSIHHTG